MLHAARCRPSRGSIDDEKSSDMGVENKEAGVGRAVGSSFLGAAIPEGIASGNEVSNLAASVHRLLALGEGGCFRLVVSFL